MNVQGNAGQSRARYERAYSRLLGGDAQVGASKTQIKQGTTKSAPGVNVEKVSPMPEQHGVPARVQCSHAVSALQSHNGSPPSARVARVMSEHVQSKFAFGTPNYPYEQEVDHGSDG
jgi:hypothetical protein